MKTALTVAIILVVAAAVIWWYRSRDTVNVYNTGSAGIYTSGSPSPSSTGTGTTASGSVQIHLGTIPPSARPTVTATPHNGY